MPKILSFLAVQLFVVQALILRTYGISSAQECELSFLGACVTISPAFKPQAPEIKIEPPLGFYVSMPWLEGSASEKLFYEIHFAPKKGATKKILLNNPYLRLRFDKALYNFKPKAGKYTVRYRISRNKKSWSGFSSPRTITIPDKLPARKTLQDSECPNVYIADPKTGYFANLSDDFRCYKSATPLKMFGYKKGNLLALEPVCAAGLVRYRLPKPTKADFKSCRYTGFVAESYGPSYADIRSFSCYSTAKEAEAAGYTSYGAVCREPESGGPVIVSPTATPTPTPIPHSYAPDPQLSAAFSSVLNSDVPDFNLIKQAIRSLLDESNDYDEFVRTLNSSLAASLTDLEKIEKLRQLSLTYQNPIESPQVLPRILDPVYGVYNRIPDCDERDTEIIYINGVLTPLTQALASREILERRVRENLAKFIPADPYTRFNVSLFYNPTGALEKDSFIGFVCSRFILPSPTNPLFAFCQGAADFAESASQYLHLSGSPVSNELVGRLKERILYLLRHRKRVILVPHSQGNFFARDVIKLLPEKARNKVGVVALASPTLYDTAITSAFEYVTVANDIILRIPFTYPANSTPGIFVNGAPLQGSLNYEVFLHSINESYLASPITWRDIFFKMLPQLAGDKLPQVECNCRRPFAPGDTIQAIQSASETYSSIGYPSWTYACSSQNLLTVVSKYGNGAISVHESIIAQQGESVYCSPLIDLMQKSEASAVTFSPWHVPPNEMYGALMSPAGSYCTTSETTGSRRCIYLVGVPNSAGIVPFRHESSFSYYDCSYRWTSSGSYLLDVGVVSETVSDSVVCDSNMNEGTKVVQFSYPSDIVDCNRQVDLGIQ